MIDEKYLSEIKEFYDGDWIVWVGRQSFGKLSPTAVLVNWNETKMDFILDGKPHKVKEGDGTFASFFNSPDPNTAWQWINNLNNMRKIDTKAILKELIEWK